MWYCMSGFRPHSSPDPLFLTSFGRATLSPGEGIGADRNGIYSIIPFCFTNTK